MGNITQYIYVQEQGNINENTQNTTKQQRESQFASDLQIWEEIQSTSVQQYNKYHHKAILYQIYSFYRTCYAGYQFLSNMPIALLFQLHLLNSNINMLTYSRWVQECTWASKAKFKKYQFCA